MRKNYITISAISLVMILSGIAGCSKTESTPESNLSTSQTESTVESTVESDTESAKGTPSESKFTEEQLKLLEPPAITSFLGPDGETLLAEDAVDIYEGHSYYPNPLDTKTCITAVLKYDFAYIRYARPFFYAGDILDENARQEKLDALPEVEWFKIRVGDKLDCGLTVKKAEYERYAVSGNTVEFRGPILNNTIEFDGEITLEGVLYTAQSTRDYLTQPGDLIFAPDPTKTSGIPAITNDFSGSSNNIFYSLGSSGIPFVMSDIGSCGWIIGKADEIDKDEIFGDEEQVRVKVTLTNVKAGGYVNPDMPTIYAEIVDIERAD